MSKHAAKEKIAELEARIGKLERFEETLDSLIDVIPKKEWAAIMVKLPSDAQKMVKRKLWGYTANIRIKKDISRLAQNLETMTFKVGDIEEARIKPNRVLKCDDVTVNWG